MTYPWPTLMQMGIVVISGVRPSVHGLGFVYCIQSAWKKWPTIWHADVSRWLTLSIHGCLWILLLVHLSVCSFTAFFLRLGLGQRRAVVIIGRWLLPSLVDMGDICCHYWQHILVNFANSWQFLDINLHNDQLRFDFSTDASVVADETTAIHGGLALGPQMPPSKHSHIVPMIFPTHFISMMKIIPSCFPPNCKVLLPIFAHTMEAILAWHVLTSIAI